MSERHIGAMLKAPVFLAVALLCAAVVGAQTAPVTTYVGCWFNARTSDGRPVAIDMERPLEEHAARLRGEAWADITHVYAIRSPQLDVELRGKKAVVTIRDHRFVRVRVEGK